MIEDLKRTPGATIEMLRGSMVAADCKTLMLGPVCAGVISEKFQGNRTELRARWPNLPTNPTARSPGDEK